MVLIDICPSFSLKLPDDGNGLKINYALKEFLDEAEQSVSETNSSFLTGFETSGFIKFSMF